ncbi:unnamed protein product [Musa textilis]
MYGLAAFQVEGDENCQFRVLADQLFHNPDYHKHVRKAAVKYSCLLCLPFLLKHCEGCVPMESKKYLKIMKRFWLLNQWEDHLTLQNVADRPEVHQGFYPEGCHIEMPSGCRKIYYVIKRTRKRKLNLTRRGSR